MILKNKSFVLREISRMSNFDSDNDFMHEEYYETSGNYYSNGIYQGRCIN